MIIPLPIYETPWKLCGLIVWRIEPKISQFILYPKLMSPSFKYLCGYIHIVQVIFGSWFLKKKKKGVVFGSYSYLYHAPKLAKSWYWKKSLSWHFSFWKEKKNNNNNNYYYYYYYIYILQTLLIKNILIIELSKKFSIKG